MSASEVNRLTEGTLASPGESRRRVLVTVLALAFPALALQPAWFEWAAPLGLVPAVVAGAALGQGAGLVVAAWCVLWALTAWALYLPSTAGALASALTAGTAVAFTGWLVGRLRDRWLLVRERRATRQEEERKLAQVERQGRALLRALPDTIYRIDRAGRILGINVSASGDGRGSTPALVGQNVRDALDPELADQLHEATLSTLSTGEMYTFVHRLRADDGAEHHYEARVVRAGEHDAMAIVRDVTQLEELSRELAEAHDNALQAAGAKGRFLATMSHQIRTPMNGVIGMTNVLMETKLTPDQQEYTTIIRNSGEALLSILDDVLDFSKMEGGEMQLEHEVFDLRATVDEVVDLLSAKAHDRNLEVACLFDARVPDRVRGDRGRLRQVITNLLGNAIKFTDEGQVVLRVTVVGHERELARIRFDVTDTGRGISREQQKKLFQDYGQADAGISRQYGGTGLGLAISQQIVATMGGHMAVESTPGKGSTFSFTVRLETAPGRTTGSFLLPRALGGAQILAGPLHPLSATVLEHELSPFGAMLTQLDDLSALPQLLRTRHRYDLVLLELPLDATEDSTRALVSEAVEAARKVPVCVIYGITRRALADVAREAGAALCLAKPLRRETLYEGLGKLLGISARKPKPSRPIGDGPERLRARVLVVEDNLVNQKVAARTVEMLGCEAQVVENGVLALEALAQHTFDIVLMDCQMPILDGFEATRRLRAREPAGRHTPVVAMTANAMAGDRERCLAAGMDDYIAKPVTVGQLDATLRRWLPRKVSYTSRSSGHVAAAEAGSAPDGPKR